MGKEKFSCASGAKDFCLCHFGFCPPFATPIYAPVLHRVIELGLDIECITYIQSKS